MGKNSAKVTKSSFRLLILWTLTLTSLISCQPSEKSDPQALSSGGNNPFSRGDKTLIKWPEASLNDGLKLHVSQTFIDDMPSKYNDGQNPHIIEQLMSEWENSLTEKTFFRTNLASVPNLDYGNLQDYKDDEMGIYRSNAWFPDISSTSLAVTQFFGTRKNIGTPFEYIKLKHADIVVNFRDFDYVWDNSAETNFGEYDLPSVIIHELGHFLGLRHEISGKTAVMEPSLSRYHNYRDIYEADESAVQEVYGESGSQSLKVHSAVKVHSAKEKPVRGIIELRASGKCFHYINGQQTYQHEISSLKLKYDL